MERAVATTRRVDDNHDLVRAGERPSGCTLVLQGLACGYRVLDGGERQITSFKFPGDLCGLGSLLLGAADHAVGTLMPCTVASLSSETLADWTESRPGIVRALWRGTLVDAAVSQAWLCNLSRRTARARVAHLLCEVLLRLEAVGAGEDASSVLPLMRAEIGDALGLSVVHVTRTLQQLRAERLIEAGDGRMAVLDRDGLRDVGGFDPAYLYSRAVPFGRMGDDGARRRV